MAYVNLSMLWEDMSRILVIGVLGKLEGYDEVDYKIIGERGSIYRSYTPFQALYNYFSDEGCEVDLLVFMPESLLALRKSYSINEAEELVRNRVELRRKLLEKVFWEKICKDSSEVISSIGEYSLKEGSRMVFNVSYDNVVAEMFIALTDRVMRGGYSEVHADISIGHNIYVSALVEALRALIVFEKLRNIVYGEYDKKVYFHVSSPVVGGVKSAAIYSHEVDVKAFFELPFKGRVKTDNKGKVKADSIFSVESKEKKKKVMNEVKDLKQYVELRDLVNSLWRKLRPAFNAIKYNVPLAFFHDKLIYFEEEDMNAGMNTLSKTKELIRILLERTETRIEDNKLFIERIPLNSKVIANILYSAALLESIARFWREKIDGREPELGYIEEVFKKLYERLGQEILTYFLERDVKEQKSKLTGKEFRGYEIRNFYAHSGMSQNQTIFKLKNGKIIAHYKNKCIKTIKKWLLKPDQQRDKP